MDVRALTEPPVLRVVSQPQPAQGNIKKKRASLSAAEAGGYGVGVGGGGGVLAQYMVDTSPITPEPVRTEFGNPNKIAQLFPELALQ
jgi:glutamine amidotransferase